ncbi:MAG: LytTR family transcriptional regulator [Clostridia bacterium]|nr:LytTR family transcriptional regulator [Clostridia bacterium]
MKVEIRVEPGAAQQVIIITDHLTPEIEALAKSLENKPFDRLTAYSERGVKLIPTDEILRIYSESQQIRVETLSGSVHTLRGRLYEYEEQLAPRRFVRISNSEIVNGSMITGMDFSLSGTICLILKNGVKTYVSRRYVQRIKKLFDV